MTLQEFLNQIMPYLALLAIALIVGGTAFVKSWFGQRTKLADLQLRVQEIDIDDTERTRKLSADAQALIQRTYSEQAELIKSLQADMRHNRDLIDTANTENGKLNADLTTAKGVNTELREQQNKNIERISILILQVEQLTAAGIERDKLKEEVATLTKQVKDMEIKADSRHDEISRMTGRNFELDVNLRRTKFDYDNAIRLLRECYEQAGKATPVLPEYPGDLAQPSALDEPKEGV